MSLCVLPSVAHAQAGEDASSELGVFVRLVTISVKPSSSPEWESAVAQIAEAARTSGLEECCDWLLYREGPHLYHAVFFSTGMEDLDTPESFARAFSGTPGEKSFWEGIRKMQATQYEVLGDLVHQMDDRWSTVESMSTASHPKGVMTRYWVRPGAEDDFDETIRDLMELLKAVEYPYPVEGFRWRVGSPNVNYINVFPDSWQAFYDGNNPRAFLERRGRLSEWEELQQRIAASVIRVEEHYIDFLEELSF